jgi:hypothetical protein
MFYLFLLAHLVADFILQPYWLVERKKRMSGLVIHSAIVLACMLLVSLLDRSVIGLWPGMLAITLIHYCADWWKVHHGHRIPGPPIVPFMVDQLIHFTTLAVVLGLMVPMDQLWGQQGSQASQMAIIASAYVAAAFAAPIAVMVWLDPRFDYLTLAGRARIRCFVASCGIVSLMLFSSALALPAAALGLVFVTRRPSSAHPLDAPFGVVVIIAIAALLGMLVQLGVRG